MKLSKILRRLDAYPRITEDLSVRTVSGAAVTLITTAIIVILIICEIYAYLVPDISEDLSVDMSRGEKLRINLDITISNLACDYVSLDAMDSSGEQHLQIDHNIFKTRLDLEGNKISEEPIKQEVSKSPTESKDKPKCGSCYGAEEHSGQCCNTCDDVVAAYQKKKWTIQLDQISQCKDDPKVPTEPEKYAFRQGCRISGHMEVNRMAGSFHIAPGSSISISHFHIHDFPFTKFKLSHTIHHLSFGEKIDFAVTHPLDGFHVEGEEDKSEMFSYYFKIVPTTYVKKGAPPIHTNQFSVTRHKKQLNAVQRGMPGLFFYYELSPLMVTYTEKERSLGHLATNICSIIGGVFTVAGIIASLLHNSLEVLQKKLEIGKLS